MRPFFLGGAPPSPPQTPAARDSSAPHAFLGNTELWAEPRETAGVERPFS